MEEKMIDKNSIRQKAEEMISRFQIPSVSITYYENGSFETVTAGFSNLESRTPANEDTMYSIGSCTKSFTAAAIAVLCDRGLLSLDDPVRKYIPEFDMYDSYAGSHLTVRDMLCHRCGLPRHELAWYPRLSEYSEKQMIDMLRHLKPNAPFRYKGQYQNMMYTLAGILISRVSGTTWENFVEETLVGPLGLGAISYDAPQFNTFEAAAQGYRYFEDPVPAGNKPVPNCSLYTMSPAGSISMSSPQLAKWDTLFLNRGTVDGRRIISEEMCSQLFTPQMLCSDPIAEPLQGYLSLSTYGMGFFIDSYRGASVVQHGGHIDGFIADQCFVPEKNFACAVLTNSEHPYGARVMRYHLLDAVLGLESVDWTGRFFSFYEEQQKKQAEERICPTDIRAQSEAWPCPASLSDICGSYTEGGYGDILITREGDGLKLDLGTLSLHGFHYRDRYFLFSEEHVLPGLQLEAEAETDRDGNVTAFLVALEPTDKKKIRFVKI